MGRTKNLLIPCDWEREHQMDFIYLLERREEEREAWLRQPAKIVVVDKRKKKKHEPEPTFLPF